MRELIHDNLAANVLDDLEARNDPALTRKVRDLEDAIARGDARVKTGPYDTEFGGSQVRVWVCTLQHRRERWAIVWSPLDDHTVKIHAVAPSQTF